MFKDFILQSRNLVTNPFSNPVDPFEKKLSRNTNRLAGALLGPSGFFFSDAETDMRKFNLIKAVLVKLESPKLNKSSINYEKINSRSNSEIKFCKSLADYTLTAYKVKAMLGMGFTLFSTGAALSLATPQLPGLGTLESFAGALMNGGLLILAPTAIYGYAAAIWKGAELETAAKELHLQPSKSG